MERIRRGFRLLGASWQVIKADRSLLVLPVLSFLAIAVVATGLLGVGWASGGMMRGRSLEPLDYLLIALLYFVSSFIAIFFNAAVVGAAMIRLQGGDPRIADGLRLASSKAGKIAGWAAITATVGLILRSLEERFGFLGDIVISLIGAAWSAITFFVVPVLLYEPVGVAASIKRSAGIFKERWGEQFTGSVSIGLAMFLLGLPILLLVALIWVVAPPVAIAVAVLGFGLLMAGGAALSGVFNAALYRYATTGQALGTFTDQDLAASFRPRRWGRGSL